MLRQKKDQLQENQDSSYFQQNSSRNNAKSLDGKKRMSTMQIFNSYRVNEYKMPNNPFPRNQSNTARVTFQNKPDSNQT